MENTKDVFEIYTENINVARIEYDVLFKNNTAGSFNVSGNFLGQTLVKCKSGKTGGIVDGFLNVIVIRKLRAIDTVFHASVAILVSIIYINFGCALNYSELRKNVKKPIGPVIGFIGQYLIMPLVKLFHNKLVN